jgi:hypothetical protein
MSMNPKYPIYVISKGRWDSRLTCRALDRMNVPYRIVIEPQEYDNYAEFIKSDKILVLPFSNLGEGSIPARNWVWEHSIKEGHQRHWILDDNMRAFYRLNNNKRDYIGDGTSFKVAEDFVDRYENVGMSGFNYTTFAQERQKIPPFYLNTRIYSCILIKNDLPHRWRGRYNEDTDLSLRILKDGLCTILFNSFLVDKMQTMVMKGGNTDSVYNSDDNRLSFAKSLQEQHPDVVKVTWKFDRWHHQVNYDYFKKNKLIKKEGLVINDIVNNYGMVLRKADKSSYFKENKLILI